MSEKHSVFCTQCGQPIQRDDKFCGDCGASVISSVPQEEQTVPRKEAASYSPSRRRRSPLILATGVVFVVLAVGVLAAAGALQNGLWQTGAEGSDPPQTASTSTDTNRTPSEDETDTNASDNPISPDSSPDPAFDPLLSELQSRTDVPIVLPAELPESMGFASIDAYIDESPTEYGIVFPFSYREIVTTVGNSETLGTLTSYPEDEDVANRYFDTEEIEEVTLPDGTLATLRYLVPAGVAGSQGPFWEGKFDKYGYTYKLSVVKPEAVSEDEVRQVLASMVSVPDEVSETPEVTPEDSGMAEVEAFIFDYFEAVERGDWSTTYSLLADVSKEQFTEEEWIEAQETRQETEGLLPPLASMETEVTEEFVVGADLTFEDGSTGAMSVLVVPSTGEKGRLLTEEDISYLKSLS